MASSWRARRVVRYGMAVVLATLAFVLQWLIWPFIPPSPQLLFYPAVFLAAWLYGAGPGYLATFVSCYWMAEVFLPPEGLLVVADASDVLDLVVFAIVACGISYLMGRLRTALSHERKAAAEARLAREAVEATWSMVAHDLRTPLNVIQLSSSDLERRLRQSDGAEAAPMERTLKAIQRSTHRASDLVRDAVDAMRLANGVLRVEPRSLDVQVLCGDALDALAPLAQKKSVELQMDVPAGLRLLADGPRLHQVLSNLLGNAIKFTPAGGHIALRAEAEADGVRFSVSDDGAGIAEDELEAIFAKFWTKDTGAGLGLGLWIAKAIVEAHGSRLSVASRKGEGTTFYFVVGGEPSVLDAARRST